MKEICFATALAASTAVSGCATIVQGTTENVSVSTTPEKGAQCTLTNTEGVWYLVSPGSVVVHKSQSSLKIDCSKPGFPDGHVVAPAHLGSTTAGNLILGGAVGIAVDAASGADYYYNSPLMVALGDPAMTGNAQNPVLTMPTGDIPPRLDPAAPNYQPSYPDAAQINGEQGKVLLDVEVKPDGTVQKISVAQTSGFADLDSAAVEAALRWRFVPASAGGNADTVWTKITINFQLPTAANPPSPNQPAPVPKS
jgi:TonB family protein